MSSLETLHDDRLLSVLKEQFGFTDFRKGQLEAIHTLLEYNRVLCIQPTGHGKSLLYQLPSCLLEGITLVISPLLALMRDQLEHLGKRFHIPAASINSDQTDEENADAKERAANGRIKVLFISPEQLDHIDRFQFLLHLNITLLVVDEAHCISTWGHDFRPGYRQILHFIAALEQIHPTIRILGLTATADARVEQDIVKQLSSSTQEIRVLRESMDRPNINLSVIAVEGTASKLLLCDHLLKQQKGSGLIYCATRENTELVAEYLQQQKMNVVAYHAGLESEEKRTIQTAFAEDRYQAVAATTALGMGIDKANLRFIIHFDIPGSITAYYQEVGRCGRDGLTAEGILLFDPADKKVQEYFIESALPTVEDFEKILSAIQNAEEPPNLTTVRRLTGLHPTRVLIVVTELIEQGHLIKEVSNKSQVYRTTGHKAPPLLSRYEIQHAVKIQELEKMMEYARPQHRCRMATLRGALGDELPSPCGHCDLCCNEAISLPLSGSAISDSQKWLVSRPVPIPESKIPKVAAGVSILDGKLRTPLFLNFMHNRTVSEEIEIELLDLLKAQASLLAASHPFSAIVPLPSTTWKSRETTAKALSEHLEIPVLNDLLLWENPPEKRQGELLNNDQRKFNIHEKMHLNSSLKVPSGTLLLLDDYIGSGATMKEAVRALGKSTSMAPVPLTIASVKWRLGKSGFV